MAEDPTPPVAPANFTVPVRFTHANVRPCPQTPGVLVVWSNDGEPLYVGESGTLRDRLRNHLSGDRLGSALFNSVASEIGSDAGREDVQAYLANCWVAWSPSSTRQELKAELTATLRPRFAKRLAGNSSRVWWINQGSSYEKERDAWVVFAPTERADGRSLRHHQVLKDMRPGDVTVHYKSGLVALGLVHGTGVISEAPYRGTTGELGTVVPVEYFPLDAPIHINELPGERDSAGPFTSSGSVKQIYCEELDGTWVELLRASRDWPEGSPWATEPRNYWIFQANPSQWDLAAHLPSLPPWSADEWTVSKYKDRMRAGDGVALWSAGNAAGVYALARLKGEPVLGAAPEFRGKVEGEVEYRAPILVTAHLRPPMLKTEVSANPLLGDLSILKQPWAGTNQPMNEAQFREVVQRMATGSIETAPSDGVTDLASLVARFKEETGHPTDRSLKKVKEREEMAEALTVDALEAPDIDQLRRLGGPAYGSPGPQPGWMRLFQTESDRVVDWLKDLVHGPGDVVERIERALSEDSGLPAVKEALVTKALAVSDPSRWFPSYVSGGKVGKREVLRLLGLPPSAEGISKGAEIVDSNDRIRALLEPHFPNDPWGMQEFCWWLLQRQPTEAGVVPQDSLAKLADDLLLPIEFLEKVLRLLGHRPQIVFYGPPGTGKTYFARALAEYLAQGGGSVEILQFHPSYSYEDFVEGYRPTSNPDGSLTYDIVDGPLKRIALRAAAREDVKHVLLIDEFNRALVSKVLGELYYLLEYRGDEVQLQYSATPFTLPKNLIILATMNTADRSIALVDAALRRRFHFVGLYPDEEPIKGLLGRFLDRHKLQADFAFLPDVIVHANGLAPDRQLALGPSHFLDKNLDFERLDLIWEHSVLPYFEEQFLDDPDQLKKFELARLRNRVANGETVAESVSGGEVDGSSDSDSD